MKIALPQEWLSKFAAGVALAVATMPAVHATNLGFGQIGGSNAAVPRNYGSNATADTAGLVVSLGGATPNIFLTWDAHDPVTNHWDIHQSTWFQPLEDQLIGGGAWDNEGGGPRIGQLDFGTHTIQFDADPGFAFQLTSFDFGHTAETPGTTEWLLTLATVSGGTIVWDQEVTFANGEVFTISPNFTGEFGEDYLLTFTRISETYGSDGRHGIDNLQFSQVAVPEPGVIGLLGLAGLAFLLRRRK